MENRALMAHVSHPYQLGRQLGPCRGNGWQGSQMLCIVSYRGEWRFRATPPNPSFSFYIALCLLRGVTLCILPGNINKPAWMGFSFGRLVCILFGLIFSRRYIYRYDEHDQKWIVYINQAFRFRKKKMKKMILWRLFRYQHTGNLFQTKTGKEIIRLLELIPFFLI